MAKPPDPVQSLEEAVSTIGGTTTPAPVGEKSEQAMNTTKPRDCIELGELKRKCEDGLKGLLK